MRAALMAGVHQRCTAGGKPAYASGRCLPPRCARAAAAARPAPPRRGPNWPTTITSNHCSKQQRPSNTSVGPVRRNGLLSQALATSTP